MGKAALLLCVLFGWAVLSTVASRPTDWERWFTGDWESVSGDQLFSAQVPDQPGAFDYTCTYYSVPPGCRTQLSMYPDGTYAVKFVGGSCQVTTVFVNPIVPLGPNYNQLTNPDLDGDQKAYGYLNMWDAFKTVDYTESVDAFYQTTMYTSPQRPDLVYGTRWHFYSTPLGRFLNYSSVVPITAGTPYTAQPPTSDFDQIDCVTAKDYLGHPPQGSQLTQVTFARIGDLSRCTANRTTAALICPTSSSSAVSVGGGDSSSSAVSAGAAGSSSSAVSAGAAGSSSSAVSAGAAGSSSSAVSAGAAGSSSSAVSAGAASSSPSAASSSTSTGPVGPAPSSSATAPATVTKCGYISGDPHFMSLDGAYYDYQGFGEYYALKSTSGSAVSVQTRFTPCGTGVTCFVGAAFSTGAMAVSVAYSSDTFPRVAKVLRNGIDITATLPQTIGAWRYEDISVGGYKQFRVSDSARGIQITLVDFGYLSGTFCLSTANYNTVDGLLGLFDGNPSNDNPANRNLQSGFQTLSAEGWRLTESESQLYYAPNTSFATNNNASFVGVNFDNFSPSPAALTACAGLEGGILEGCLKDVTATSNNVFAEGAQAFQEVFNDVNPGDGSTSAASRVATAMGMCFFTTLALVATVL